MKLWEILKDKVRHRCLTCKVICSLSGLLKRDSCSSVRLAFHMWALPGWSDNEKRETESSGGEMKSPLPQTDRRRDRKCANIYFFKSNILFLPVRVAYLLSILFTGNSVSGLKPVPARHQSASAQMWGFRVDILTQELIIDWPWLF